MKIASLNIPLVIFYFMWCVGISSFTLNSFAQIIQGYLAVHYDYKMELIMVIGQVGFQWLFMLKSSWSDRYQYSFLALTVSMIGALMLLPLILYSSWAAVAPPIAVSYFSCVVLAIFLFHHLLIQRKHFPSRLTFTWVLYRCLLLLFVVYPRN